MFCKVRLCPHALFHVTSEHYCRRCQKYGHGIHECGDESEISALKSYQEELPEIYRCQYPNCARSKYHITEAHYCQECKHVVPCIHMSFGLPLGKRNARAQTQILSCPLCRTLNELPCNQPKLYHENPALCVVCKERMVEVFLPACGHAILCRKCTEQLSNS